MKLCLKTFSLFFLIGFTSALPHADSATPVVREIVIDDFVINPVVSEYILQNIEAAEKDEIEALIIKLDTPGGLLSSTRTIVKRMMNADVPLIVYVAPDGSRAGSAGVFITLAAHIAAMAPSTNIGAAHPVQMGGDGGRSIEKGEEKSEDPMAEKIMNDTLAWVTSIAKARGRNVRWAREAVEQSSSIPAAEALKKGVIDAVVKDETALLKAIHGKRVQLSSGEKVLKTAGIVPTLIEMSVRQRILNVLINPNIAYILMMLGFYGLLFEFTHPGTGFPGIAGAICLILAFYAFHTLPTNYAGVALIILAIVLFIAEVKFVSYGLLSLGGIVSLTLGSILLFDSPNKLMQVSLKVVIPVVLSTAGIFTFLLSLAVKSQRARHSMGLEALVGTFGVAETDLELAGKVFIHGELWNARSERPVKKGAPLEVIGIEGMLLTVKEKEETKK